MRQKGQIVVFQKCLSSILYTLFYLLDENMTFIKWMETKTTKSKQFFSRKENKK